MSLRSSKVCVFNVVMRFPHVHICPHPGQPMTMDETKRVFTSEKIVAPGFVEYNRHARPGSLVVGLRHSSRQAVHCCDCMYQCQ